MNVGVPAPLLLGLTSETRQSHVTGQPARRLPRGGPAGCPPPQGCRGPAGARSSPRRPLAPGGSHGCPQGAGTVPEPRIPSRRGSPTPCRCPPPRHPGGGQSPPHPPPPPPPRPPKASPLPPCLRSPRAAASPRLQGPGGHGRCHPPLGPGGGEPCQPPVPISHGFLLGEALRARSPAAFSGVSLPRIWGMRGEGGREGTGMPKRGCQKVLQVPHGCHTGGGRVGAPFCSFFLPAATGSSVQPLQPGGWWMGGVCAAPPPPQGRAQHCENLR